MKLLRTALLAASAAILPIAANAAWQTGKVTDSFDAQIGIHASVFGKAKDDRHYSRKADAKLGIHCIKNETRVGLTHDGFAFFADPTLRYKIDDKEPVAAKNVTRSQNYKVVGWWNGNGINFAKSLYGAKALKIEVVDGLNGSKTVFEFDIEGAQEAFAEVAAACKWGK